MAADRSAPNGKALSGALALAVALGALHAFSVILLPLQQQTGASLSSVSFVYSAAIVALTVGVLASDRVFRAVTPRMAAMGSAILAATGLLIAAAATNIIPLVIGYGLVFGFANGVGYSLFLSEAGKAMPERQGFAVGLATAAYAAGAMLFAWVLRHLTNGEDAVAGLVAMAFAVALAGCLGLLVFSRARRSPAIPDDTSQAFDGRSTAVLWLIYLLGATGGLMVTAHAAGIVSLLGGSFASETLSVMVLAAGNAAGSILGGRMTDTWSPRACLALAAGLGGLASLGLALTPSMPTAIALIALTGFAYGALISIVPRAVDRLSPPGAGIRAFGRVFTAWGAAGLVGPWLGGVLFDLAGLYAYALFAAAALSLAGAAIAWFSIPSSRTA